MRSDQFSLFESWYRWHAKEGAEWFAMDLLGGMGTLPHEVRFVRPFNAVPKRGALWTITTELETRQRPIMDEGVLAIALDSDANALILTTNNLHTFVHTTLPGSQVWSEKLMTLQTDLQAAVAQAPSSATFMTFTILRRLIFRRCNNTQNHQIDKPGCL